MTWGVLFSIVYLKVFLLCCKNDHYYSDNGSKYMINRRGFSDNYLLLFCHHRSGYVTLQLRVMLDTPNQYTAIIDLCHAAAILSQEIKKALYFHGLAVQIQSFFNLLGEKWLPCDKGLLCSIIVWSLLYNF